jgi:choline dehydrogenase-like flavoprotein
MHIDCRVMPDNSLIEGDICIVGSGAAGISMALDLARSNKKIILLEGGGFSYEEKTQDLNSGTTSGQNYFPLRSARLHYFGGTTGHWSGFCSPLDPIDFEKRDWVDHSGWPITKNDLDPYYEKAQPLLELGPYDYSVKYWKKDDPDAKSLVSDQANVWNKMWQFSPPTSFGKKYRKPVVESTNIHLYTYAQATEIKTNEDVTAVTEIVIRNHAGKTHRVKAKRFVLACCSVQNARLLLASNKQAVKGIGNDRDLVGRYFMEHLEVKSAELWLTRPFPMNLYHLDFANSKPRAELAITAEAQRKHKVLNGTSSLDALKNARGRKPIIELWSDPDPRKSHDNLMGAFDSLPDPNKVKEDKSLDAAYEMFTRIEQSPNPSSRVTLGKDTDAFGVPYPHLHWALTEMDKRSIRNIYRIIGKEVGKSGVARVRLMEYLRDDKDQSWPSFTGGGWHHMGTTRMHNDPAQGVVDQNCKVHGLANLYIAGSSCFTTAGAANPTLSVVALSLRLANHLNSQA